MTVFKLAVAHLKTVDPVLRSIIARVGKCNLHPVKNHFLALLEAIVSQQLSVKAAATIFSRFLGLFPDKNPKPREVLAISDARLRQVGLSRQKLAYIKDLADKFDKGVIKSRTFHRMADAEIIQALVQVKGVGRWTAEMFLIFSLNRPDVLPVDDLGFRKAIKIAYRLRNLPKAEKIEKIAKQWHPYCSVAAWYLWTSLDTVPVQSKK
jgi:DNA-3-methyladenine glycosylase II